MEKVILEIHTRTLNQYHALEHFPVKIGRALDNDIIISDPSVSPYHLEIDCQDEQITIQSLAEENGTRINQLKLAVNTPQTVQLPVDIKMAHRYLRLLSTNMPVTPTSISACRGMFGLFCNTTGITLLVILSLLVVFTENYFNSEYDNSFATHLSNFLPSVWFLLAIGLVAAGLTRLAVNRWEIGPSIGMAALFLMIPHILSEIGHIISYFLTADWPMEWLLLVNKFLLLPTLLFFFIHRVHDTRMVSALGLAILLSAPLLVFQATDMIDSVTQSVGFSEELKFNRTVSSLDIRLAPTVSQAKFMSDVHENLGTLVTTSE